MSAHEEPQTSPARPESPAQTSLPSQQGAGAADQAKSPQQQQQQQSPADSGATGQPAARAAAATTAGREGSTAPRHARPGRPPSTPPASPPPPPAGPAVHAQHPQANGIYFVPVVSYPPEGYPPGQPALFRADSAPLDRRSTPPPMHVGSPMHTPFHMNASAAYLPYHIGMSGQPPCIAMGPPVQAAPGGPWGPPGLPPKTPLSRASSTGSLHPPPSPGWKAPQAEAGASGAPARAPSPGTPNWAPRPLPSPVGVPPMVPPGGGGRISPVPMPGSPAPVTGLERSWTEPRYGLDARAPPGYMVPGMHTMLVAVDPNMLHGMPGMVPGMGPRYMGPPPGFRPQGLRGPAGPVMYDAHGPPLLQSSGAANRPNRPNGSSRVRRVSPRNNRPNKNGKLPPKVNSRARDPPTAWEPVEEPSLEAGRKPLYVPEDSALAQDGHDGSASALEDAAGRAHVAGADALPHSSDATPNGTSRMRETDPKKYGLQRAIETGPHHVRTTPRRTSDALQPSCPPSTPVTPASLIPSSTPRVAQRQRQAASDLANTPGGAIGTELTEADIAASGGGAAKPRKQPGSTATGATGASPLAPSTGVAELATQLSQGLQKLNPIDESMNLSTSSPPIPASTGLDSSGSLAAVSADVGGPPDCEADMQGHKLAPIATSLSDDCHGSQHPQPRSRAHRRVGSDSYAMHVYGDGHWSSLDRSVSQPLQLAAQPPGGTPPGASTSLLTMEMRAAVAPVASLTQRAESEPLLGRYSLPRPVGGRLDAGALDQVENFFESASHGASPPIQSILKQVEGLARPSQSSEGGSPHSRVEQNALQSCLSLGNMSNHSAEAAVRRPLRRRPAGVGQVSTDDEVCGSIDSERSSTGKKGRTILSAESDSTAEWDPIRKADPRCRGKGDAEDGKGAAPVPRRPGSSQSHKRGGAGAGDGCVNPLASHGQVPPRPHPPAYPPPPLPAGHVFDHSPMRQYAAQPMHIYAQPMSYTMAGYHRPVHGMWTAPTGAWAPQGHIVAAPAPGGQGGPGGGRRKRSGKNAAT